MPKENSEDADQPISAALDGADIAATEDLHHQLRTPIAGAYSRVEALLRRNDLPKDVEQQLAALRGLLGRARQVMRSVGAFAKLASGAALSPLLTPVSPNGLMEQLADALYDTQAVSDPGQRVEYELVNTWTPRELKMVANVDPDMLDQALRAVLDNARKYSYTGSKVILEAKLSNPRRCTISIRNVGLGIPPEDIPRCTVRGWRGQSARACTGEGSGIGLWMANELMKAQGGELKVLPTTPQGVTEVQLILPME
jgi:signal transduction histidine kinase